MTARASATLETARTAAAAWSLQDAPLAVLGGGLINDSFVLSHGRGFVLQRVHPVFAPQVHLNIAAVTTRLRERGVATPELVATDDGALWLERDDGVWRLMTRMPGVSFAKVREPAQAAAAAGLLARFHVALVDLPHSFVGMRTGVHDTDAHLAALREAIAQGRDHRLFAQVDALADAAFELARQLPRADGVPDRVVHGDPKFNNVLFEGDEGDAARRASCLVDLDTVGPMPLHLELGDMWRSWCNRSGEDANAAAFDLAVHDAALDGYARARSAPTAPECEALVHGVEWITLELAVRFATDALRERYFGWDATTYSGRGEHNLVRAQGQLSLHRQVLATRAARAGAVARAPWASPPPAAAG